MTTGGSSDSTGSSHDPPEPTPASSATEDSVSRPHGSSGEAAQPTSLSSSVRPALKWSLVNTGGAKIVGLLSGVILARLLTPHDYGLFAIAFIALNLSNSLNDAGLQAAITRWPGEIDTVAPTAVTVCILTSVVCYGLLFVLAPPICAALGAPEATEMIRVLSLILIFSGFDSVPAAVLSRNFRQDRQAIADLASTASVGLTILLAYLGYGAWSFVWGQLAGNLIGTTLIVSFAPVRYWPGFDRAALRQLIPQGLPLAGSAIVSIGVINVDYISVGRLLGPVALGYYLFAYNISSWPLNLSVVTRRVSLPAFAKLQHDPQALNSAFVRSVAILTAVSVPICVLIAALSTPLVSFVYGDRWLPAASPLRYLAIFAVIRIVVGLSYDAIVATGRARASLWLQAAWLVVLIPAIIAGTHLAGITGTAIAQLVVGVAFVAPIYLWVLRRVGISLGSLGRHLFWPGVAGAVAGVAAAFSTHAVDGNLKKLAVGGSLGLLAYGLCVLPVKGLITPNPRVRT
jgi:O-antigen/teichoic acid export membrane protein